MAASTRPEIKAFFDEPTNMVSYLVWDPATKEGAVIDPVLNFDHRSGDATVQSADEMLAEAKSLGITIKQILETHAHADHLFANGNWRAGFQLDIGRTWCVGR